jgi:uncharacterized protein
VAVDPTPETSDWRPIGAPATAPFPTLWFVDGARRIDTRLLAMSGHELVHGLFGTLAVGAVRVAEGRAAIERVEVKRLLILGAGFSQAREIAVGGQRLQFEGLSTAANGPAEVLAALQNRMRETEARLAEALPGAGACLFADGPLNYVSGGSRELAGIVKRVHMPYLAPEHFQLVARLAPGTRTPLFSILESGRERYSWFLRIGLPRPVDHPLAGLVRLEVAGAAGLERAVAIADTSASQLVRFASSPTRDPRAPQNLLPVGALEAELKRRMGDPWLVRRAIEQALWMEARS